MAILTPRQTLESYRKSDAVFIICQNNAKKMLEIAAINDEAASITGYGNEDIAGHPFSLILPERISSIISEFIEYEENKNDLQSVLSKVRDFAIKKKDGKEAEFRLRIVSGQPVDRNPCFYLVLIDEQKMRDGKAFRNIIKENFKGHEVIDPHTELPDRASLIKDLELMNYYVQDKHIKASFAVVDINYYDSLKSEYGEAACYKLHKHISEVFRQKLRVEDTLGTLSESTLGLILMETSQEEARMVLNRLRWAISVNPMHVDGEEVIAQVNISFMQIDGKMGHQEVLKTCEEYAQWQRADATNSLQLVVTEERRAKMAERRFKLIPVPIERRRNKERRLKKGKPTE